ncbi:PH domain-containing protein [Frigoriglobus tundricola]|uniref:DoxX family protein n=1 Tax=Frigoriglobus tundricola TaxID=2774151 RepID=A0A6M5YGA4_9BACT|nr:hypothetical protein [Frigoriglobus tundricola]QJW93057.1 hypothetical protein FTUN_0557 [Frigoriglobus tundricola]
MTTDQSQPVATPPATTDQAQPAGAPPAATDGTCRVPAHGAKNDPYADCPVHKYVVIVPWSAQVLVAILLAQTLYFKFTYAPQTRYIFEPLGGRPVATAVGLFELLAVVLILIPRTAAIGAVLALGLIGGAIMTHLTTLGISVVDPETGERDGGLLFSMALAIAFASLVVLWYRWADLPLIGRLARR